MARIVYFKTGITAPDGVEEVGSMELCALCDREAEYADKEDGFCHDHWIEHLAAKAENRLDEKADYQEGHPDPDEEIEERELHRAEIAELDHGEEDGLLD